MSTDVIQIKMPPDLTRKTIYQNIILYQQTVYHILLFEKKPIILNIEIWLSSHYLYIYSERHRGFIFTFLQFTFLNLNGGFSYTVTAKI